MSSTRRSRLRIDQKVLGTPWTCRDRCATHGPPGRSSSRACDTALAPCPIRTNRNAAVQTTHRKCLRCRTSMFCLVRSCPSTAAGFYPCSRTLQGFTLMTRTAPLWRKRLCKLRLCCTTGTTLLAVGVPSLLQVLLHLGSCNAMRCSISCSSPSAVTLAHQPHSSM